MTLFASCLLPLLILVAMHSLSQFVFTRVLNEDPVLKTIALLGTLPSPTDPALVQPAVLLVEKTHFATQSTESDVTRRVSELLSTGSNDIYSWWNATLSAGLAHDPDLKMSMIYPATEAVRALFLAPSIRCCQKTF